MTVRNQTKSQATQRAVNEQLRADVKLADLFAFGCFFGEKEYDNLIDLNEFIVAGAANVFMVAMPDQDLQVPEYRFSGQAEHQSVCGLVASWFDMISVPWSAEPRYVSYCGYRADIAAVDGSLFVECGYTNAGKVLAAIESRVNVMVVPYAFEINFARHVGFMFKATDNDATIKMRRARIESRKRAVVESMSVPDEADADNGKR